MGITIKSRKHNGGSSTSSDLKLPTQPARSRSKSPSAKTTSTSTKLIRPDSLTGLSKLPREKALQLTPTSSTASLTSTTDFSDPHAFRALPGFQSQRNSYGLIDCFADCDKKSYGYGGFKKRCKFLAHLREIHGQEIGNYDRRGARSWKGHRKPTMMDIGEMAEGSGVDAGARTGDDTDYGIESDGLLEPPMQYWIRRDSRGEAETKGCPLRNTEKGSALEQDAPADIDRGAEMEYEDWFEDEIQFDQYHLSHFDLFGVWLERKMGTQLDWWPLRPPVHPDTSGLTRMSWKCKCGSTLSSVISNDTVGSYQRPQSSYGDRGRQGGPGFYPIKKPGPPQPPPQPTVIPPPPAGAQAGQHVHTKPPPQPPATPPPPNDDPGHPQTSKSPQKSPRQSPSERLVCPPSPPYTPQMRQGTASPEPTLVDKPSISIGTYILCCIRKGWYRTVLIHLGGDAFKNDQEFFCNLRDEYRRVRGWWHWCGLSVVVQIRFVRFTQYYLDFVDCHESGVLPPPENRDYDYHPKPPRNPPTLPVTELMHYFDSPECAGTATYCLDLLPKRIVGRLERGTRAEGWGLQPGEGLSLWRLLVLLLAVWIATMAFAVWWLVGRADLQGAFVPAGYAVAVVAVGVVLPEMRVVWVK